MPRSTLRLAAAVALACLAAGAARAQSPGACIGFGDLKDRPDLAMARIDGAPKVPFVKDSSDAPECPAPGEACRAKAYLVPGNRVIAGAVLKGFTCVDYVGATGDDRAGWVASINVVRVPEASPKAADWVGRWTREEAEIRIKPATGGRLALAGDATYGAKDPDRVKRGGVNIGNFEAVTAPEGASLAFAVGTRETLPVDKGEEGDCKVWMRRLGPYLLVDDNNDCGGMNVTFRGIYRKAP